MSTSKDEHMNMEYATCLVDFYGYLLQEGQTPLHLACQKTDVKIVKILLSQDTSCMRSKDKVLL